jgi:hypothetical protein
MHPPQSACRQKHRVADAASAVWRDRTKPLCGTKPNALEFTRHAPKFVNKFIICSLL